MAAGCTPRPRDAVDSRLTRPRNYLKGGTSRHQSLLCSEGQGVIERNSAVGRKTTTLSVTLIKGGTANRADASVSGGRCRFLTAWPSSGRRIFPGIRRRLAMRMVCRALAFLTVMLVSAGLAA